MTPVHWLLLAVVIAVVGGAYWYLRRHNGSDPWRGMDEAEDAEAERGVSLNGDSYIVGVRTLTGNDAAGTPTTGAGNNTDGNHGDAEAEAAWSAYKTAPATSEVPAQAHPEPAQPEAVQPAPQQPAPTQPAPEPEPPAPEAPAPSAAARVENIRPVRPPAGEERIFVLHITSPSERYFDGPQIHAALDEEGLKFGLNDLYHRITDANGEIESVYCIANMLKPGVLDPVDQDHLSTPGLTLFLVLPGAIEGVRAMRDMMETAHAVAKRLGGQVLDDKRSLLNKQTAQYMLDEIAEIDRQTRLRAAP